MIRDPAAAQPAFRRILGPYDVINFVGPVPLPVETIEFANVRDHPVTMAGLALDKLAESGNSKLVILPADFQDAVRGLLGRSRTS